MQKEPSLEQLKQGDSESYQFLYENYRGSFLAFAKAYSIPKDIALEVYQEAMIKLYENIMSGQLVHLTSSLKTYVFSIGKFKIYEYLRAQKKLVPTVDFKDTADPLYLDEDTILSERQQQLKRGLDSLGDRCRNILELFYLNGYSIKEIMTSENYENENTVKAQKSRCLRQLKTLLKL